MSQHGLLGCKTCICLLCCLCELLRFESSQTFLRTPFSRILVWKRILAFSYPRRVDDRAAFTLLTPSVLKRRSSLQSKNGRWSQLLVTTFTQECKLVWSRPHRGWCPPPSRQPLTALWQITYLKNRSTYETAHKFIKINFSLYFVFKGKPTGVLKRRFLYYFEEVKGRMAVSGVSVASAFSCGRRLDRHLSNLFIHSLFLHLYWMHTRNLSTPVFNFVVPFSHFTLAFHD